MQGPRSILFVCLGNICRSPAAEAAMRVATGRAGLPLLLDSAGTGNWHVGAPPHPPMIAAAGRRGYDLTGLRARQIAQADFGRFDLILAMDAQNLADIARIATPGARVEPFLPEGRSVPDPYFTGNYDETLDCIDEGVALWLDHLTGYRRQIASAWVEKAR